MGGFQRRNTGETGTYLVLTPSRRSDLRSPEGFLNNLRGSPMQKEKHITILGILHIARGALVLFIGMMGFAFFTGIGFLSGDTTAMGVLGFIGTFAVIFMGVLALPEIVAGVGLLQRREWGRIVAIVVGIFSLIDIPFGTALGVYTLWVLMDDNIKTLFISGTAGKPIAAQQASAG
jgi:hypothetical protein